MSCMPPFVVIVRHFLCAFGAPSYIANELAHNTDAHSADADDATVSTVSRAAALARTFMAWTPAFLGRVPSSRRHRSAAGMVAHRGPPAPCPCPKMDSPVQRGRRAAPG